MHLLILLLLRESESGVTHMAPGPTQRTVFVRLLQPSKKLMAPPKIVGAEVTPKRSVVERTASVPVGDLPARPYFVAPSQDSGTTTQKESLKPTVIRMATVLVPSGAQDFAGAVTVEVTVGVNGELVQALILASTPRGVYDSSVLAALATSEYRAGRSHLGPVVGTLRLQFDFSSGQVVQTQDPQ